MIFSAFFLIQSPPFSLACVQQYNRLCRNLSSWRSHAERTSWKNWVPDTAVHSPFDTEKYGVIDRLPVHVDRQPKFTGLDFVGRGGVNCEYGTVGWNFKKVELLACVCVCVLACRLMSANNFREFNALRNRAPSFTFFVFALGGVDFHFILIAREFEIVCRC